MLGKVVLSFVFVLLLLISSAIFIGHPDIRSHFVLKSLNQPVQCGPEPPIRVYMYDLPRRFNVGMLNSQSTEETPVTAKDFPPWPDNSGLRKQHSVEYWMMGSLLYERDGDSVEDSRDAVGFRIRNSRTRSSSRSSRR